MDMAGQPGAGAVAPLPETVDTVELCAQRCMNTTACRFFQYQDNSRCALFRDCGFTGSPPSPARVYGYRAPAVPAYVFEELMPQGECASASGTSGTSWDVVLDQANCLSACQLDQRCTAVEINDDISLGHNCEMHVAAGNGAITQTASRTGFRCWQKQSTYLGCYQVSWPTVATVGVASDGARAVPACPLLPPFYLRWRCAHSCHGVKTSHRASPSARRLRSRRGGVCYCVQSTQPAGRCVCTGVRWVGRHSVQVPSYRGIQPI